MEQPDIEPVLRRTHPHNRLILPSFDLLKHFAGRLKQHANTIHSFPPSCGAKKVCTVNSPEPPLNGSQSPADLFQNSFAQLPIDFRHR